MSLWKRIRHRLEAAAMRGVAWYIPRLSRGSCVRMANAFGELAARLDFRGRAVALENLRCAFGDTLSPAQRGAIVRESYRNFARAMLDLFWAPALALPENRRWLRIELSPEAVDAMRTRGAVFISVHFGNWEWTSVGCGLAGWPCVAVAENFKNPALTAIVNGARQSSGQTIIAQENSMLRMLKTVKRGGRAGLLADLTLRPGGASTIIRAFGMEICVSVLHAVLAQRAAAAIIPLLTTPDADGGCTWRALPPIEVPEGATLREIAQACWDFYEPHIRSQPGLWLWPYKHFRYRPRDAAREYPDYANVSGAFDKLRNQPSA